MEQVVRNARCPTRAERDVRGPRLRRWVAVDADRHAELSVAVSSNPIFKYVSVRWSALPPQPPLTAREKKIKAIQDQFYARYTAAGERAYATPPRRIGADATILLVGELEADVNNGGFSQYLEQGPPPRGRGTARAAADRREQDGGDAQRGAGEPGDDAALEKLDAKFYRSREDLAVLAMTTAG